MGGGVTNPAPPDLLHRLDSNGRLHRRPLPSPMASPASLDPSPHFERREWGRSRPPPRFPSCGWVRSGKRGGSPGIEGGPIPWLRWSGGPPLGPPLLPPYPSPLREGGWVEIGPRPVVLVRWTGGSRNVWGSPQRGVGPDMVPPIEGRASPQALLLSPSPTRMSGAHFTHRGGEAPPGPPPPVPSPFLTSLLH